MYPGGNTPNELKHGNDPEAENDVAKNTEMEQAQSRKSEFLDIDAEESETEGIPGENGEETDSIDRNNEWGISQRSVSPKSRAFKEPKASEHRGGSSDRKAEYIQSSEEIVDTPRNGTNEADKRSKRRINYWSEIRSAALTGDLGRSFLRFPFLPIGLRNSGARTTKDGTLRYRSAAGQGLSSIRTISGNQKMAIE